MPTESEYRAASDDFRRRATSYRDTVAWSPPQPSRMFTGHGPIGDTVDERFGDVLRRIGEAADELAAVARECDRRAEVCRTYQLAVHRYRSLPAHIRALTPEPVRPARWVDR